MSRETAPNAAQWLVVYKAYDPRLQEVQFDRVSAKPPKTIGIDTAFPVQNSTGMSFAISNDQVNTAIILTVDKLTFRLSKLSLHDSTMADNNAQPPNQPPTNPPAAFYTLPEDIQGTMRRTNYTTGMGCGIFLPRVTTMERVLATPVGDSAMMCESNNRYAIKVVSLIINDMRTRTDNRPNADEDEEESPRRRSIHRVGERASVDTVLTDQAAELATLGNFTPEPLTQRRLTTYWYIMCGFNADDEYNGQLDNILHNYARIRLGDINKDCDEFGAAVWSIKMYYDDMTTDSNDQGPGIWTLPGIHLLNGHLIHRGMTPISFHQVGDMDEQVAAPERVAHSDTIWLNGEQCKVENREHVRAELIRYLRDVRHTNFVAPEDEGPPPDKDQDNEGPPAQRRRILHLG